MKPSVKTKCPANAFTADNERIIEFSDRESEAGGLISFRRVEGKLYVDVYRCDGNVVVNAELKRELRDLKAERDHQERKMQHGCWDFSCPICDPQ